MEPIDRLRGNTYHGPCNYKSAIQLPTKLREDARAGVRAFIIGLTIRAALEYFVDVTLPMEWALLGLTYRLAFVMAFGYHFCHRFTLMDDEARYKALCLYFFIGLPLSILPAQFALIALIRPRWCCRAIADWFTYPDTYNPGLFRSPLPFAARIALSFSFDFHMALLAMFFASFAVTEDKPPTFHKLFNALRSSPHQHERESVLIGLNDHDNAPHLEHVIAFTEHVAVFGKTKSGKSAFMACLQYQLSVILYEACQIVLNCKSNTHEQLAEMLSSGKPVKWMTFMTGLSSYVLNPLDQSWYLKRAPILRNGFWAAAINLDAGPDHGRQWFSVAGVVNLIKAAARSPKNLREMLKIVEHAAGVKDEIKKAGSYVRAVFEFLKGTEVINEPSTMQLESEIESGNYLYFGLPLLENSMLARYLGSIALQSAVRSVFTSDPTEFKGFIFADEAQAIGGKNTEGLLNQARSVGLSIIASMQMADHAAGQVSDLGKTLQANAGIEFIFSATTDDEIRRVQLIGGQTVKVASSFVATGGIRVRDRRITAPQTISSKYAVHGLVEASHMEMLADRYPVNEIGRISAEPRLCIVRSNNPHYLGACNTVRTFYHIDERTYLERCRMPWPKGNGQTVIPGSVPFADEPPPPVDTTTEDILVADKKPRDRKSL